MELLNDAWLKDVARNLQHLAGEVVWDDVSERPLSLVKAVDSLPAPSTPIESLLLRGLLWESALRIGCALHDRAHPNRRILCPLNDVTLMVDCLTRSGPDPRRGFAKWAVSF